MRFICQILKVRFFDRKENGVKIELKCLDHDDNETIILYFFTDDPLPDQLKQSNKYSELFLNNDLSKWLGQAVKKKFGEVVKMTPGQDIMVFAKAPKIRKVAYSQEYVIKKFKRIN